MSRLIVLDPGHGGSDPGAVANGQMEKTVVLQTCVRLREGLKRAGFRVLMTRETDVMPLSGGSIAADLSYRAQLANRANADLFLSWHADSASAATASGQTAYVHPNAGPDTSAVAYQILEAMSHASGLFSRGVREADFAVLRETAMPAVLIESAFISNPQEAALLADPVFQQKIADAAVAGLCCAYGIAPPSAPPTPVPAPATSALDRTVGESLIAWLGQCWAVSGPDVRPALQFAADHLRDRTGLPKPNPPIAALPSDGAKKAIALLGAMWGASGHKPTQDALHETANALRSKAGLPV